MTIFTVPQLSRISRLLMSTEKRPRVIAWLAEHYNIHIQHFVHDELTVDIPTTLTEEDGAIIFTELMALFG